MFDVYLYDGVELPTTGYYYVIASNGIFIHKDLGFFKTYVPVEQIPFLNEFSDSLKIQSNLPKMPAKFVIQIKEFFKRIAVERASEAIVLVYYNRETKEFMINVPQQEISHVSCRYEKGKALPPYYLIGTIHSHCDFNAYHSNIDTYDEQNFDGLHCTFGHNNKDNFTISASFVVNGHRFMINPLEVFEGIDIDDNQSYFITQKPESSWLEEIDVWQQSVLSDCRDQNIEEGDYVDWIGPLNSVNLRHHCGQGPFFVSSVDDQMLIIECEFGKARFSKKLFKKVNYDQKN
jgi:hypothetical protein